MATAVQKITLSSSRDIPFNKLVLSQSNVRRVKAGVSIEELADDIARRGLLTSINVRPELDAEGRETGIYRIPAGGRRYRALKLLVDVPIDRAIHQRYSSRWQLRRLTRSCPSGGVADHSCAPDEVPRSAQCPHCFAHR